MTHKDDGTLPLCSEGRCAVSISISLFTLCLTWSPPDGGNSAFFAQSVLAAVVFVLVSVLAAVVWIRLGR